jgi:hypothetical protein
MRIVDKLSNPHLHVERNLVTAHVSIDVYCLPLVLSFLLELLRNRSTDATNNVRKNCTRQDHYNHGVYHFVTVHRANVAIADSSHRRECPI